MEYLQFASDHWELTLALVVTLLMLVWNMFCDQIRGITPLGPLEATGLINREHALVVDVREERELAQLGTIPNSVHMSLGKLKDNIAKIEKDKSRPILAVCKNGSRSSIACGRIKKAGFDKVYNLKGGLTAWKNSNLPLTTK